MCYDYFNKGVFSSEKNRKGAADMSDKRIYFISELNFRESMEGIVEPFLENAARDGYFDAEDGKKIHYVFYKAQSPVANIVICHGFTESGEKFREMSWYFLNMGLNVFVIDNRGHGYSHRHNDDPEIVHIKSFDQYIDDLDTFVKKVVLPAGGGLPLYLYAHSMGGAIGVGHLQKHPGVFEKAVLSAPMIKAKTAGIPEPLAKFATRLFILLGKEKEKVIGYNGFNPDRSYEDSHDTSKARFDYYHHKRKLNSRYQTSAPSYRWVSEAIRVSPLNLDRRRNEKITASVLLCQPEIDSTVVSEAEDVFVSQLKNGRLVRFTDCKHEIYNSIDSTVSEYLDVIEEFLLGK